jgi:hypothetical protein
MRCVWKGRGFFHLSIFGNSLACNAGDGRFFGGVRFLHANDIAVGADGETAGAAESLLV